MDDINLIPKEADLTLNTLKLNSEDSDLIVSPTKETSNNSDLILNNYDEDNLELEVSQLDLLPELDPDLIDPKSFELRVMTKHDPIKNTNMSLEDRNLKLKDFEPNWNNEHSLVLLESILGVAPLDLHLIECVFPDLAYLTIPYTNFNVRDNISPYIPVASLTIVPAFVRETLPHLLSPIPAGDSLGYSLVVMSHDPSPYRVPDSYILPSISSSFPIKDHLSPSWLTLLDYTTATGRPSMTLAETSYRNALVAKDVFIAPPTPIPLNICQGQSNFLSGSFQEPNSLLPCCPQPASLLSSRPESVLVAVRRRSGVAQLPEGTSSAAYNKPSCFLLLSRRPEDLQAPARRFPSPEKLLSTLSSTKKFPDLVPSRFPVLRPLGFPAARPWDVLWLAGAFWAAVPCDVWLLCYGLLAFSLPLFYWLTWEVSGCLFPSSFPIYIGCFVENGLVDFGEFISVKPEGLSSLRASLLLRLLLQKTCGFSSSRLLTSFFYTQVTIPSIFTNNNADFKPTEPVLDWPTRKRVSLGTARGLEYLHEHCNPKIIHRDVKAANVLLDEDFEAVVGDFGLAKLVDVRKTSVTTQVRGTMGHIAPEYLSTGKSSERTDVFGYGIMLLELVTGQRAIDFSRLEEEDDVLLLDHVKKLVREKRLDSIIDRNLKKNYNAEEVEKMIQVALLCTQATPEDRPTMSEVVRMLEGEGLAERWEEWQQVEVTRRQEYERLQRRFDWGDDSVNNLDAIELSGGR
ncbi:hypothetical protein M5K25_017911 [Dendrobium thyrsiflorum]|uniref:Protein kinase domain-containing protein n=1 Tax=Dendrobium thyrsiflorum TaxID=117978 RepID=A0ABD0UH98_DENTH